MGLVVGQSFGPLPYGPLDHPLTTILPLHPDRYQEKYAPVPIAAASASGAPATLLSLPVELLQLVLDLVEESDRWTMFSVCFRLLELASERTTRHIRLLDDWEVLRYVHARVRSNPLVLSLACPVS